MFWNQTTILGRFLAPPVHMLQRRLIITSTFKFSSTKAAGGASERGNPLQKRREKTEKEAARFRWHTNKEAFRAPD